jgi:hypothetical protein
MRREGVVIAKYIGVVSELFGRADVMAEHIFGRGHTGARREMVDQRANELGLGGPFFDACGEIRIHGLRGGRGGENSKTYEQDHSEARGHEFFLRCSEDVAL